MKYFAHTKDGKTFVNENECQKLVEHLNNTAFYAMKRAEFFEASEAAYVIGLLHDIGKYSDGFQAKIKGKVNISVPHAMAGAFILNNNYDLLSKYYGIAIASHHTGLSDYGTLVDKDNNTYCGKLNNHKPLNLIYENEVLLPAKISHKRLKLSIGYEAFQFSMYLRMLFSVLVDSDFTDTEEFCTDTKRNTNYTCIEEIYNNLMDNMPQNTGGKVNTVRAEILNDCLAKAENPQGLFSLCVPTGGGKTLSSLAFALKHAQKHGLRRVIYVIPYTSIIEQNAEVFREKVGAENVLEHHSGFEIDSEDFKARWASENWDIPIIVTTNVQFFESLFAAKTTKSRKIHNITKSVVIFDEAQMLPGDYLSPCMAIISELITNYGVTAVLCSATQPLVHKYMYKNIKQTEIISNHTDLASKLKRVNFNFAGKKSDDEIILEIANQHSVLLIVNSRKHAFSLYEKTKSFISQNGLFYLSTLLTPADRTAKINEIKRRLATGEPVVVISTQLLEAGVDVDFPVVYRSLAGIDSIIQAGGRANREGKLADLGKVIIFEPTESPIPRSLQLYASCGKEVIECLNQDAVELAGITKYFELLNHALERDGIRDMKGILNEFEINRCGEIVKMNFATAAKNFNLIDNNTHNIVIPCNKNLGLIKKLRNEGSSRKLLRKLQKYSINIYDNEFIQLQTDNALEKIDGINLLIIPKYYSPESGLNIFTKDNKNAECAFI